MNELELYKQILPVLEIKDYELIRKNCEEDVKKYENYLVTIDTLDDDVKLRAELNKKAKAINDKRLEIEKEISKPIKDFKEKCDLLKSLYEKASGYVDIQIKNFENIAKSEKEKDIKALFELHNQELKELLKLEMIFDEKWYNKGFELDKVEIAIKEKLSLIGTELEAIKKLNSEYETSLIGLYLKTFNLSQVILENNRLQELKIATQKTDEIKEEIKQEKIIEATIVPIELKEKDEIRTYKLEITGTITQLERLKDFLKLNNMSYTNIDKK